ncbi:1-acyl-sn-glycerol-3-phosphate acyltransferase [Sinobacterium caligoides]|uniref:1-acyl-sn-glycerol-3-phosphate acyltransferase n=1 Tax=Sinobacterium caligoides TaxID=933926 RepID=A0A3N2DYB7_9GAMM|nr:lysophospholipid acyltransferase family protein [Sinobacterium caligoides]ROS04841.1 1-acyl-sn-glycerol-3-phosphate acyltransferase [Sinobacterium caligoides]
MAEPYFQDASSRRAKMIAVLRLIHKVYSALIFLPLYIALSFVLLIFCVVLCLFDERIAGRYVARPWGKLAYLLLPSPVKLTGSENLDPKQSYVVVVNHISQFDILALYGWLDLDLKWVMKKELRMIPIIGWGSAAMGHIFLDRKNRDVAKRQLNDLKKTLRPGVSVLFFPEGTRSPTPEMLPFKKGAFIIAKDLELPILPVTINGTQKILPVGGYIPSFGRAHIHIHPPLSQEQVAELTPSELSERAQAIIATARKH